MSVTYLITGALGCIGSWSIKHLVEAGHRVVAVDVATDRSRLHLISGGSEIDSEVAFASADVTDRGALEELVHEHNVQRIIHLAALQVPASHANPPAGASVNVVGTTNVLDVTRTSSVERAVFASSVAVYGPELVGATPVPPFANQNPDNFYGVFKRADEGVARLFHKHYGVDSTGLRPHTVYGPGRDTGLTSAPTWAMLATSCGEDYQIPFSGEVGMQYASDVAETFIMASQSPGDGTTYSIRGAVADMSDLARMLNERSSSGKVTVAGSPLPFPAALDDAALKALLGPLPGTSLKDGVEATIAHFVGSNALYIPKN